jgi:hypothetical protein
MSDQRPVEFDLFDRELPQEVVELVSGSFAREHRLIPVSGPERLVVAMAKVDGDMSDKLRFIFNGHVSVVYASPEAIQHALDKYYPQQATTG